MNSKKLLSRASTSLAVLAVIGAMSGCVTDKCDMSYTYARYTPVYMSATEFEQSVKVLPAQALVSPGKIYVQDDFLFVNETGKGVHIFDNKDAANPVQLAFLQVPGNYDISATCDKLILDSSKDLLVFDISNPAQPALIQRYPNALPHITSFSGYTADASKGIVVSWEREIVTEKYDCEAGIPMLWQQNQVDPTVAATDPGTRTVNPASSGKAGSMSRFTTSDDYLYIVSPSILYAYNISGCSLPTQTATVDMQYLLFNGAAEMVSSQENLLLVGTTTGVFIFDASQPATPVYTSTFQHVTSCDPVIANGDYAYVTLRDGQDQQCGQSFTNQLDVLNISNPHAPYLVSTTAMTNPHGLGLDGTTLFIADGRDGVKVFDAKDPAKAGRQAIAHISGADAYDVIPHNGILIMTGKNGIYQYDYSNLGSIRQISHIAVQP
ncbi:MAG: hypothetical protein SF053_07225 [Bacteroidia bacterium]|nr:hypothetical protein [Bacteroidia bacterium]